MSNILTLSGFTLFLPLSLSLSLSLSSSGNSGNLPNAFRYCQLMCEKGSFTDSPAWQSCVMETSEVDDILQFMKILLHVCMAYVHIVGKICSWAYYRMISSSPLTIYVYCLREQWIPGHYFSGGVAWGRG